uniref:Transient receptor potential cation channel subfamily A member 1 n=1 Tax=Schistosoma haematobium TaxID=6185 RepID=A0A095AML9_SCHHA
MIPSSKNNWFDYIESKTTNYSYLNIIPEELKIYKFQDHFYNFLNKLRSSLNSKRNSTKLTTISETDPNGRITDLVNSNIPEIQMTSYDGLQNLKYLKDNELSKYEDIIYAIQNDSIPLNSSDNMTNRILHYSVEYGYTDLVKWLLNNGADPNYINELGNQPIHSAVSRKHVQILQLLIDFGAKVDAKNRLGAQAIHLACEADFIEGLELLLEIAVDANTPDEQGATPVHYCCFNDSAACLQMLIQAGGNIYQTDALGKYPIHEAISQSSLQCLKILLDYNQYDMQAHNEPMTTITEPSWQIVNSMITNTENHKSISVFSRKYSTGSNKFNSGSKDLTNSFEFEMRQEKLNQRMRKPFKKQQLIHLRDVEGLAPIHAVASSGSIELLNICLQYNPDVLAKDQNGQTVLHYAALRGDLECVKAIIKNISLEKQTKLIQCSNENQETCLHLAAKHNFVDMVDYLISLGSNINQQDINGYTPIMSAAIKGSINVIDYLLNKNIIIKHHDIKQRNLFHLIVLSCSDEICNSIEIIKNLKELPELLNDVDNYGYTPLHYATKLGLIETCLFFLRYGANVTVVGENKCTPLHLAAKFGRLRISQVILNTIGGMRTLSMTDSKGCLPLHIAAYYGQDKLLELFLKNGFLFRRNNSRTIEYLLSNGAEIKPDHNGLYFSNYAITRQNEAAVKEIVLHERWPEIVELLSNTIHCPFKELIEYLPEICLTLFDFSILQPPLRNRNRQPTEPLQHLKIMILHKRDKLLAHPLCEMFLKVKWSQDFGIFIIMFIHVTATVAKLLPLSLYLLIGFATVFQQLIQLPDEEVFTSLSDNNKIQFRNCFIEYTSSLNHSMNNITKINRKQLNMLSNIGLTFFDTIMMMMGEYKRTKIIIQSYLEDQVSAIPYPKLTFIFYIAFIILIPITLISLTIGLAVGDIDKARRSATQELIYRQVYWLDSLEANLPRWLYAKICVQKWLLKPARPNVPRTEYNIQKIGMVQLSIAPNHAKAINTNNGNTIGYWKLR